MELPGESAKNSPVNDSDSFPSFLVQANGFLQAAILDALTEHVVITGPGMKVIWCNRAACDSTGLERNKIIGRECFTLWCLDTKPCADCPVQRAVESGIPCRTEKTTPDGRSWDISGYPLRDESGAIAGAIEVTLEITELKKTESRYREEHEFLNSALLTANDGLWDFNIHEDRGVFNTRFFTMLGYEPEEIAPTFRIWKDSIHPDDRDRIFEQINSLKPEGDNLIQAELRFLTRHGGWKWIMIRATVTEWDGDGNPGRMIGANIDIHKIKIAEETIIQKNEMLRELNLELTAANEELETMFEETTATNEELEAINEELLNTQNELVTANNKLYESEQFFRQIAENSPNPICIINSKGIYEYLNPTFKLIFGYTYDDIASVDDWFRLAYPDPEYREQVRKFWNMDISNPNLSTVDRRHFMVTSKDGSERLIHFRIISFADDKHYIIMEDVTERKLAEEMLRENEEKYRSLVESMREVVYLLDLEGHIQYVSPSIYELSGYSPEDLTGKNYTELIHPDDLEALGKRYNSLLSGEYEPLEYRLRHKKGATVYVKSSSRLVIQNSVTTGVTGLLSDITSRKLAEKESARLQKQLMQSQKLEAIGTLAGGIAHDFNNILTAIIGYTDLSIRKCDERDDIYGNLQHIMTGAKRASELVQQMLTFSRGNRSCKSLIEISPVIREVLKLLNSSVSPDISIEQDIQKKASPVMADPTQIHQLIMNLCTNALHSMNDTGGTLTVKFEEIHINESDSPAFIKNGPGNYVKLMIRDTGHGIHPTVISRIFEPFFTTKGVGEGTGMGLSVVHGIVNNLDGDITVESTPSRGSEFTVIIPVAGVECAPELPSEESAVKTSSILLLSPESGDDAIYPGMLEGFGYRVLMVNSTVSALEAVISDTTRFDLVIMDTAGHDVSQVALTNEIKKIRPDIPVIICADSSNRGIHETGDEIMIDAIIEKPISRKECETVIRNTLETAVKRST